MKPKTRMTLATLAESAFDALVGVLLVAATAIVSCFAVAMLSHLTGRPEWACALFWCLPLFLSFFVMALRDKRGTIRVRR